DQRARIAGPPRLFQNWDRLSGDFATTLDHFAHTRAAASAEIVESTGRSVERENMRMGQIDNMDVIANAGAIRRFVIGPENLNMFFLSQCNLEHVWNQMRFAAVIFSKFFR